MKILLQVLAEIVTGICRAILAVGSFIWIIYGIIASIMVVLIIIVIQSGDYDISDILAFIGLLVFFGIVAKLVEEIYFFFK